MNSQPGSLDAALQEILNTYTLDLADDGSLSAERREAVAAALQTLPVQTIEANLALRLEALGSTAAVPSLRSALDETQCCPMTTVPFGACLNEGDGAFCGPGQRCTGSSQCPS